MPGRPSHIALRALAAVTEPLLQCVFPPACHVCRGLGLPPFCDSCRQQITQLGDHRCQRCLDPLPTNAVLGCCDRCAEGAPHSIDAMVTAGAYEGPLLEAVQRLKYGGKTALGGPLGGMIAEQLLGSRSALPDILVPVPLHWTRRNMRGFNQSELIAAALGEAIARPVVPHAMRRTRRTQPQARLDHHARAANVSGAFRVSDPSVFVGRHVGLVDDVVTTLHTSAECARVLAEAGASRLTVLCAARA